MTTCSTVSWSFIVDVNAPDVGINIQSLRADRAWCRPSFGPSISGRSAARRFVCGDAVGTTYPACVRYNTGIPFFRFPHSPHSSRGLCVAWHRRLFLCLYHINKHWFCGNIGVYFDYLIFTHPTHTYDSYVTYL